MDVKLARPDERERSACRGCPVRRGSAALARCFLGPADRGRPGGCAAVAVPCSGALRSASGRDRPDRVLRAALLGERPVLLAGLVRAAAAVGPGRPPATPRRRSSSGIPLLRRRQRAELVRGAELGMRRAERAGIGAAGAVAHPYVAARWDGGSGDQGRRGRAPPPAAALEGGRGSRRAGRTWSRGTVSAPAG